MTRRRQAALTLPAFTLVSAGTLALAIYVFVAFSLDVFRYGASNHQLVVLPFGLAALVHLLVVPCAWVGFIRRGQGSEIGLRDAVSLVVIHAVLLPIGAAALFAIALVSGRAIGRAALEPWLALAFAAGSLEPVLAAWAQGRLHLLYGGDAG